MISQEQRQVLQELGKTQYGQALRALLNEKLADIKDISNTKTWEETLGRQFAVRLIKDIFSFMEEKISPSKESKQYE
jgi:hypothetical protein